jgi:hypothetical protein
MLPFPLSTLHGILCYLPNKALFELEETQQFPLLA